MLTAGGTGGHIMPAVAIAQAVRAARPEADILFVGTTRGMEERISRQYGLDFAGIPALGIKGKSAMNLVRAAFVNTASFFRALRLVASFRPSWIVGTGGYVTGMVVLAGKALGCRLAIQEQNSVPGLTNRILAPLADRVYLSFPDALRHLKTSKARVVGNPLRRELIASGVRERGSRVLVLGGSLGATSINRAAAGAFGVLRQEGSSPAVTHQCGERDYPWVKEAYEGMDARVVPFIDDMAAAYAEARLAVCRCGGITLAELSHAGIPAIMVPYPHAADDHQRSNGRYVADSGGGWLIEDTELSAERLACEIRRRLEDAEGLDAASRRMKDLGLGAGAQAIAEELTGV
jgi:UDP-N-acetylglucosamine--N-acetylmuramyl-(pentapeptide) pyrophosphoryl-undecaprenol N-acetylglucosamine transferase